MKCAAELLAISIEKKKENEARKAAEIAQRRKEAEAYTIKYCQMLADTLEERANNGEDAVVTFHARSYHQDSHLVYTLVEHPAAYADGRRSFSDGPKIDLDYLKRWFGNYCFKVEIEPFWHWEYGLGRVCGGTVRIKPDPDCL